MEGKPGDRVLIESERVGMPARRGEIVEVICGAGGDHYRVRWEHDLHESIYYPAPGARIERSSSAP